MAEQKLTPGRNKSTPYKKEYKKGIKKVDKKDTNYGVVSRRRSTEEERTRRFEESEGYDAEVRDALEDLIYDEAPLEARCSMFHLAIKTLLKCSYWIISEKDKGLIKVVYDALVENDIIGYAEEKIADDMAKISLGYNKERFGNTMYSFIALAEQRQF